MMDEQLDDVARRGEPLAALTASEASIYERFGYGTATFTTGWELASEYARLAAPATARRCGPPRRRGRRGRSRAGGVRARRRRRASASSIARPTWWSPLFTPGSRGPRFFTAVHDGADGHPDAFARYALDPHWPDGVPGATLRVIELQAVDADAEAAMWTYLFGIDLVATVIAADRPVDDPLRWRLPDARRLRVRQLRDHLWVRVVDVAAALAARTYGTDDALVVELIDELPAREQRTVAGRRRARPAPRARAPTATADLTLTAPDLGAIYLGGVPVSTLAAAGRVRELTTGAVQRADRFFLVHPSPWCTTHF